MKYKMSKDGKEIEKSDFTEKYKPDDFRNAVGNAEKRLKEMMAQQRIYKAKMENVSRNNPFVLDIEDEKRNAIWLYQENFVADIKAQEIIDKLKEGIKEIKGEMSEIEKQTKFKF